MQLPFHRQPLVESDSSFLSMYAAFDVCKRLNFRIMLLPNSERPLSSDEINMKRHCVVVDRR